jgi:hypothetical protein
VVAQRAWYLISRVVGFGLGSDYESIAKLWLCNKRFGVINIVSSAMCWCIWKLRNCLCFQGVPWSGMKTLWQMGDPTTVLLEDSCPAKDEWCLQSCLLGEVGNVDESNPAATGPGCYA